MTGSTVRSGEEPSKRVCNLCGLPVSSDEKVCPHCGNVFRKDEDEWEWKLVPGRQTNRREERDGQ